MDLGKATLKLQFIFIIIILICGIELKKIKT